jgi:hypothetical protein
MNWKQNYRESSFDVAWMTCMLTYNNSLSPTIRKESLWEGIVAYERITHTPNIKLCFLKIIR